MDNNLEKKEEDFLEHLIRLSKIVAQPWKTATIILGTLLTISIISNVIISKKKAVVNFSADSNIESTITQKK